MGYYVLLCHIMPKIVRWWLVSDRTEKKSGFDHNKKHHPELNWPHAEKSNPQQQWCETCNIVHQYFTFVASRNNCFPMIVVRSWSACRHEKKSPSQTIFNPGLPWAPYFVILGVRNFINKVESFEDNQLMGKISSGVAPFWKMEIFFSRKIARYLRNKQKLFLKIEPTFKNHNPHWCWVVKNYSLPSQISFWVLKHCFPDKKIERKFEPPRIICSIKMTQFPP